jgi:hypothetical protein
VVLEPEQKPKATEKPASPKPNLSSDEQSEALAAEVKPTDPVRDILAEDLRDTLLEKISNVATRARVLEQVAGEPLVEQIKFIKRWQKTQSPPAAAGQMPAGNVEKKLGFFERTPPDAALPQKAHRYS